MTMENGSENTDTNLQEDIPKEESKSDKFSRLASIRASRAIDGMTQLRRLANTDLYEFTPDQVTRMLAALQESLNAAHEAFASSLANEKKKKNDKTLSFRI